MELSIIKIQPKCEILYMYELIKSLMPQKGVFNTSIWSFTQKKVDGPMLEELIRVQQCAPEFFYSHASSELKLDFFDCLRFGALLKKL